MASLFAFRGPGSSFITVRICASLSTMSDVLVALFCSLSRGILIAFAGLAHIAVRGRQVNR